MKLKGIVPSSPIQGEQAAEVEVSRNAHGQTLDDARGEFRAAWQAKLDEKERQIARARRIVAKAEDAAGTISLTGAGIGLFMGLFRLGPCAEASFPSSLWLGLVVGIVIGLPFLIPIAHVVSHYKKKAEQIERSVREMQHL